MTISVNNFYTGDGLSRVQGVIVQYKSYVYESKKNAYEVRVYPGITVYLMNTAVSPKTKYHDMVLKHYKL